MKKLFISFVALLTPYFLVAQVVTTNPAFITRDYNGQIVITFDPSQGNGGMVGATKCFAHTGLITSESATDSDWKFATPTWRGEAEKYRMVKDGNFWKLTISPNLYDYYACPNTTVVRRLAFVFNDGASGTKEGKTADGKDIFVEIYETGLNVNFASPVGNQLVAQGATVNFLANASENAVLELKINGNSVKNLANISTLTHSQTFTLEGDYRCVITATNVNQMVSDSLLVCVAAPAVVQNRPAGTIEGVNYFPSDPTKAVLVFYAKDKNGVLADNVFVVGDMNDWAFSNQFQMKKDAQNEGYFWLEINNLTSNKEYAYQYAVKMGENVVKVSDAYAEKTLDGWNDKYISSNIYPDLKPFSEGKADGYVAVLQTNKQPFNWSTQTQNFTAPDKNNLVIYELWVNDFSEKHSVNELINRLDYLKNLGINAIELMPITEFDGNVSWGYNPNHYFAPDKAYGTANAYKTFIDECHKRGIAVIFDMVFNHATGNNPFAKLYWNATANNVAANNPYFNVTAPHEASVFHDFNHNSELTRNYFKRVLQYWLTEYKIDGYRMDLSKGFCGENCNNRVAIINDYYNTVKTTKSNVYFILEHWYGSEEQGFVDNGMLCWGGGESMNNAYSQTAMGWLKDGDNFLAARKKGWVYYCESHDEQRNFYKAQQWGNGNLKTDEAARLARVPLNVGFNIMLEGPKMLWQFEEMGYDFSINRCPNGTESENCRTNSKPLPESLGWYQNAIRMDNYKKIAQMLALRNRFSDMFLNGTCALTGGSGVSARYIQWQHNSDRMIIAGNFNVEGGTQFTGAVQVAPFSTTGVWYDYFSGTTLTVSSTFQQITLAAGEIRIFSNTPQILPEIPREYPYTNMKSIPTNKVKCSILPTITSSEIFIEAEENVKRVDVFSLRSEKVLTITNDTTINVSSLPSGLYLMLVTFNKHQQAFKFIKE